MPNCGPDIGTYSVPKVQPSCFSRYDLIHASKSTSTDAVKYVFVSIRLLQRLSWKPATFTYVTLSSIGRFLASKKVARPTARTLVLAVIVLAATFRITALVYHVPCHAAPKSLIPFPSPMLSSRGVTKRIIPFEDEASIHPHTEAGLRVGLTSITHTWY